MSLSGMCDLHCHYVPAVDDGVADVENGLALCRSLRELGFTTVVATPHMRAGMFDNDKPRLSAAFESFCSAVASETGLPELGLASEHFFDETFMARLARGETLPYPGGHAALVEFPPERFPLALDENLFRMRVRGLRPVIAHPERYAPLWSNSAALEHLLERGALALLDVMSLAGKYGRKAKHAAERMLEEELYFAACSDSHKPADVELVAESIARLIALRGAGQARTLLCEHPRDILSGSVVD
ncbi:MAG TPA: CpsB/CapC family capsule biosynthesis tyrosine phosphatase [Polyangiales bacterium]|nr:CpsB/CapC family capsule biosynthesis tyrosine phosphatase [Polyangiales bacterium]